MEEITNNHKFSDMFASWRKNQQEECLDFCSGARGVKLLYDSFFKEILNPKYAAGRLEEFLSLLLGQQVRIVQILPNDSVRIADEGTLLITDIVVELEDGSIANIEVQKIGYMFPGQRCACYSADLLLRQYKRIQDKKEGNFSYKDIRDVYTIVLYEKSPVEFKNYPAIYLHHAEQKTDSGLELKLLQKYIFIPLDIFRENQHNKPIRNKLDAWLMFVCMDEPEEIIRLIETYPEFRALYKEIYELCQNTEKVMEMFSKELLELDRNTVQYMIDDMQDTINDMRDTINEQTGLLKEKDNALQQQTDIIREKDDVLQQQADILQQQTDEISALKQKLAKLQPKNE